MLCKNCGKEIKIKKNFCPFCGCRINESPQPEPQDIQPEPSFSDYHKSQAVYSSYRDYTNDTLVDQLRRIHEIVSEIYEIQKDAQDKRTLKKDAGYFKTAFCASFFFLFCLIWMFYDEYTTVLTSVLGHFFGFIGTVLSIIVFVWAVKKERARQKAINLEEEAALYRILSQNKEILSTIPKDYWTPEMTGYMYKIASDGRADNLKTIIEMANNEQYRREIGNGLNSIRSNSASIAKSSRFTAFDTVLRRLGL